MCSIVVFVQENDDAQLALDEIYVKHAKQAEKENCQSENESKNRTPQNLKNKKGEYCYTEMNIILYATY